jgi:ribosome-associated protein
LGGDTIEELEISVEQKIEIILHAADEKKGVDVKYFNVKDIGLLADYYVIITATSSTHLEAMVGEIKEELKKNGQLVKSSGVKESGWIVIDAWDVFVHIMLEEQRTYFNLEEIWTQDEAVVYHE